VTIETDNKKIIIKPAQVVELNAKGTRTFSISGNITEIEKINEEDVELVAQTAQVDKEKAKKALLQTNGNVADAIMLIEEGRI
jgi:nascent polypeptide-associated complex subunit alpha